MEIPRFRGNAIEEKNFWRWEGFITFGEEIIASVESKKTFRSKEAAIEDMRENSIEMLNEICENSGFGKPGGYIDLNKGKINRYEKKK